MEPPSEDETMDGRDGDVLHADEVEVEGDGQEALFDFVDDGKSPESDGEGDAASDDGDEVAPPPPKKGKKELSPLTVPSQSLTAPLRPLSRSLNIGISSTTRAPDGAECIEELGA